MKLRGDAITPGRNLALAAWGWCLFLCLAAGVQASMVSQTRWEPRWQNTTELCRSPERELPDIATRVHRSHSRQVSPLSISVQHRRQREVSTSIQPTSEVEELQAEELVKRIFAHDILLSPSMLEQGLSNLGNTANLQRAMLKLLTGKPIKVVMVGGSVSKGHGNRDLANSYFQRVVTWINATFPHPEHVFKNHAIAAATSSYVSPCVLNLVPDDTDIVLLEFTFNDSERSARTFDDPTRRGLERLLRKLMRMQSQPALIYLHYWAMLKMDGYTDTVEDSIDIVLKYYGVMSLSMRTALHLLIDEEPDLRDQIWWPQGAGDSVHPTCIGSRYLADLIIGQLQDQAATALAAYLHNEHEGTVAALWNSVEPNSTPGFHPVDDDSTRLYLKRMQQSSNPVELGNKELPRPVLHGNWGNLSETCMLDSSFKDLITPRWGFEWTDEGRGKWGFVAHKEWSRLEITVPFKGMIVKDQRLLLGLGFLQSYQHMGMAQVECEEGCTCDKREYSFTLPAWARTSEPVWKTLKLYLWEKFEKCTVIVTVLEKTHSRENPPEHKVKLLSLMMTGEMDFVDTWSFCEDCLNETDPKLE